MRGHWASAAKECKKPRLIVASGHLALLEEDAFFHSFHKNVLGIFCEDAEMSKTAPVLKEFSWIKYTPRHKMHLNSRQPPHRPQALSKSLWKE